MNNLTQQVQQQAAPTVENGLFKAGSLWALIGITSWADAANFMTFVAATLGALYSCILVGEWAYKKIKSLRSRYAKRPTKR